MYFYFLGDIDSAAKSEWYIHLQKKKHVLAELMEADQRIKETAERRWKGRDKQAAELLMRGPGKDIRIPPDAPELLAYYLFDPALRNEAISKALYSKNKELAFAAQLAALKYGDASLAIRALRSFHSRFISKCKAPGIWLYVFIGRLRFLTELASARTEEAVFRSLLWVLRKAILKYSSASSQIVNEVISAMPPARAARALIYLLERAIDKSSLDGWLYQAIERLVALHPQMVDRDVILAIGDRLVLDAPRLETDGLYAIIIVQLLHQLVRIAKDFKHAVKQEVQAMLEAVASAVSHLLITRAMVEYVGVVFARPCGAAKIRRKAVELVTDASTDSNWLRLAIAIARDNKDVEFFEQALPRIRRTSDLEIAMANYLVLDPDSFLQTVKASIKSNSVLRETAARYLADEVLLGFYDIAGTVVPWTGRIRQHYCRSISSRKG